MSSHPRTSIRGLFFAVALVALLLAAFRQDSVLGLVVGCIILVACKRSSDAVALIKAIDPGSLPDRRLLFIHITSTAVASAIVLGSNVTLIIVFGEVVVLLRAIESPHDRIVQMLSHTVIWFPIFGLPIVVSSRLRKCLWLTGTPGPKPPARWRSLWPMVLILGIGVPMGFAEWPRRAPACRERIDHYAQLERRFRDPRLKAICREHRIAWERKLWWCWVPVSNVL